MTDTSNINNVATQVGDVDRQRCLMVFKYPAPWNHHVLKKFSIAYQVQHVYADSVFKNSGSAGLIQFIDASIRESKIDIVIFDIDFYLVIDRDLISQSSKLAKKRVALSFDDLVLHESNSITASVCDMVLTADPISALKYLEKGIPAEYLALEASKKIYFERNIPRDIDVLHFGTDKKADRGVILDYLESQGIKVTRIGTAGSRVTTEELPVYISRAKIVVNFAKTDFLEEVDFGVEHSHPYFFQLKGRVIEAGLCKTACISEYTPAIDLLFRNNEVLMFRTKEECYALIRNLLDDENMRNAYAENLYQGALEFEDEVQMSKISKSIDNSYPMYQSVNCVPINYKKAVFLAKFSGAMRRPIMAIKEMTYLFSHTSHACGLNRWVVFCASIFWGASIYGTKLLNMISLPRSGRQ
jgi:hypothetical protein